MSVAEHSTPLAEEVGRSHHEKGFETLVPRSSAEISGDPLEAGLETLVPRSSADMSGDPLEAGLETLVPRSSASVGGGLPSSVNVGSLSRSSAIDPVERSPRRPLAAVSRGAFRGASGAGDVSPRAGLKHLLGRLQPSRPASGATLLIYHRIGGGTSNELDLGVDSFEQQLGLLADHDVVSLDAALDRLEGGSTEPSVVLTFDDGFDDVYVNAWPLLRARSLPFTIYLASAYVSDIMRWEGSTATGNVGRGLSWDHLAEMVASGLCTVGNHTHNHARPEALTAEELDTCTEIIEAKLGVTARHFTYPWGIPVPAMEPELRTRFRSASTGVLGRNLPGADLIRLARVPVRRTDPPRFFAAKLSGNLGPERAYAAVVGAAKRFRISG